MQGTYPVISLTFANVKEQSYEKARLKINSFLEQIYQQNIFLKEEGILSERETEYFDRVSKNMDEVDASLAIHRLSEFLSRYYGKKVIILLDEYDTPMQEAYINGFWDEMVSFTRNMFNSAFKTNPYLERAVMTGITAFANSEAVFNCECDLAGPQSGRAVTARVSKESIFSDLNNLEVEVMFEGLIRDWFMEAESDYNAFIRALLMGDLEAMNDYMNEVAAEVFSSFDTGKRSSGKSQPERFYHGFVLGLLVELQGKYYLRSNRESGFGRYDVMLEPKDMADDAILIEFKVRKPAREGSMEETVFAALRQIDEKQYDRELIERGILPERIRKYGFAFEGKNVLIGDSSMLSLDKSETL